MAEIKVFQKLLSFQEREKNQAQKIYQQSVQHFEEYASQLYSLLKSKENAEKNYELDLETTSSISNLSMQYSYIQKLKRKIIDLEVSVNKARKEMEKSRDKLTEAHIEVKKFEKLIEVKEANKLQLEKLEENKMMDEISTQQFLLGGNR